MKQLERRKSSCYLTSRISCLRQIRTESISWVNSMRQPFIPNFSIAPLIRKAPNLPLSLHTSHVYEELATSCFPLYLAGLSVSSYLKIGPGSWYASVGWQWTSDCFLYAYCYSSETLLLLGPPFGIELLEEPFKEHGGSVVGSVPCGWRVNSDTVWML